MIQVDEKIICFDSAYGNSAINGVCAGSSFTCNFGESLAMQAGLKTKAGADVRIGKVMIGISYIMALNITDRVFCVENNTGLPGLHVLFQP